MGTKLRNISTNTITKVAAFLLVVIFITAAVLQAQYVLYLDINPESLFIKEYKNSESFYNRVHSAFFETIALIEENQEISQDVDFYYYVTDGEKKHSNTKNTERSFFQQYEEGFYAYENGEWKVGENTNQRVPNTYYSEAEAYTVYLAFPDKFMTEKQLQWEEGREVLLPYSIGILTCLVLTILLIIYLMIVTGRRPEDQELHLSRIDNIYSDLLVFVFFPIGMIWLLGLSIPGRMTNGYFYLKNGLTMNGVFSLIVTGIFTAIVTTACLLLLLSFVRKAKAKMLIKHSFIYQFFYKVYDLIKSLLDGRRFEKYPLTKSLFYRQLVFIITSFLLVFFTFSFLVSPPLFLFPPLLEIAVIYWYVKYNNKTFEEINAGFNESLEEQMKSERMKVTLITNVSHDLKTPLTSIISYIDLLSKEEDLSESARDYVNILADKSNRLKQIVSDLFDLAKSTSGDIHLDLETLDMKRLIEQTLGDMEDKIEKSGLQIKTSLPDHPTNIHSDGKKLYRVFQNVIDNALKYSLKGTRIYVDLEEKNGKALATIKNIAGYEMDFTAEEILQRFNRGDKSRSTDGSGLGLSIAESFTRVCGGDFNVTIDGDLFKVEIGFSII